jgi:ribosomal protein S18 acetylase RimI-like enzyme
MALIAIMCTAIGTAVGSMLQDMQGFQLIMNFIEGNMSGNTRRAVPADISRIMAIRHAVCENRLSDPNSGPPPDCAAFIDRSEIWVWVEEGLILGFAAGDVRDGWIWALFVAPGHDGRGTGRALLRLACESLRNSGCRSRCSADLRGLAPANSDT